MTQLHAARYLLVPALLIACGAATAADEAVRLADIKPRCGDETIFKFDRLSKACVVQPAELEKLKSPAACEAAPGVKWTNGRCVAATLEPSCGSQLPNLVVIGDQCAVKRTTPSSQTGDYEGDCLRIALPPDGNVADFPHGADFKVISQEVVGQDRRLLVARGESMLGWLHPYFGGCGSSLSGSPRKVMASSVVAAGTNRMGWTYGMLALPFKYFGHDKSFSTAVSLGPYVGRRFSTAGSAVTLAGAAALGSVQGEVRDAAGAVTGTPELTSFSWAAGVMWDISKNSGTRPFKMGVFYGKDYVSEDSAATYKHNRKSWLAFQIGFDFTDN